MYMCEMIYLIKYVLLLNLCCPEIRGIYISLVPVSRPLFWTKLLYIYMYVSYCSLKIARDTEDTDKELFQVTLIAV
jgi:hypothetical protein